MSKYPVAQLAKIKDFPVGRIIKVRTLNPQPTSWRQEIEVLSLKRNLAEKALNNLANGIARSFVGDGKW